MVLWLACSMMDTCARTHALSAILSFDLACILCNLETVLMKSSTHNGSERMLSRHFRRFRRTS